MEKSKPYRLKVYTDVANCSKQEKWVAFSITLPCGNGYMGEYHWDDNGTSEIEWNNDDEPCLGENQKEMMEQIKEEIRSIISTYNLQTRN
jgi:hypothetical protein